MSVATVVDLQVQQQQNPAAAAPPVQVVAVVECLPNDSVHRSPPLPAPTMRSFSSTPVDARRYDRSVSEMSVATVVDLQVQQQQNPAAAAPPVQVVAVVEGLQVVGLQVAGLRAVPSA